MFLGRKAAANPNFVLRVRLVEWDVESGKRVVSNLTEMDVARNKDGSFTAPFRRAILDRWLEVLGSQAGKAAADLFAYWVCRDCEACLIGEEKERHVCSKGNPRRRKGR